MSALFKDRYEAGRRLAERIGPRGPDTLVLGLVRGGVPVAFEVANALGTRLDVFVVRKLGTPGREELALGAVASGGVRVLNEELIAKLRVTDAVIGQIEQRERRELERRETLYRGEREAFMAAGHEVILIDDGVATGASMHAAARALRSLGPARLVVAAPVAAPDSCASLAGVVDEIICAETPSPFESVGRWYAQFDQTSDDEVRSLLERHT